MASEAPPEASHSRELLRDRTAVRLGLVVFLLGVAVSLPRTLLNSDEALYLDQALAFAQCERSPVRLDPETLTPRSAPPGPYPLGTPLLQALGVLVAGSWRGAYLVSVVGVVTGVLATARLLELFQLPSAAALLILVFPTTHFCARLAMSDAPSLACVALALVLVARGTARGGRLAWLGAGLLGGASLLLRETNPLVLGPFFLGALLRGVPAAGWAVAGGVAGASLRPLAAWWVHGDPWYVKDPGWGFSLSTLADNLPLYAFALLVMTPGGLVAAATYRGPRRAELLAALGAFVGLYLIYEYSALESGGARRVVLATRFLLPALPLLCLAMADLARRRGLTSALRRALVGGAALASIAAPVAFRVHGGGREVLARAIEEALPPGALVVTNVDATGKLLLGLDRSRGVIDYELVPGVEAERLAKRHGSLRLALLDRGGSPRWEEKTRRNERYHADIASRLELSPVTDVRAAGERLRVWLATPR